MSGGSGTAGSSAATGANKSVWGGFSNFRFSNFTASNCNRKKILDESAFSSGGLKRCMSKWNLMAYGIGCTVGAGVFVLTGLVAREQAGPSVCLSYVIGGFAAMLSGLCYAEFASRTPVAGSAYTYVYTSMTEIIAFFVGWNLTLEYAVSGAAVATSWSSYFKQLMSDLGWDMPVGIADYKVNDAITLSPLALALVIVATLLMLSGIENLSKVATITTAINMIAMFFFIIVGSFYVDTKNWSDDFFPYGVSGTLEGAGSVFFAYVGFDATSALSAEAINPETDIPFGLISSLTFITTLYFLVGLVLTGMVPYKLLDEASPLSAAFKFHGQNWASICVGFASISTMAVLTTCSLVGQPRVWYAMSKDGLLFTSFQKVHGAKMNPTVGTIATGIWAGALAFLLDLDVLGDIISAGILLTFATVCGGALLYRIRPKEEFGGRWCKARNPLFIAWALVGDFVYFACLRNISDFPLVASISTGIGLVAVPNIALIYIYFFTEKVDTSSIPFRCYAFPFLPLCAMAIDLYLVAGLKQRSLLYLLIWTLLGYCVYFGYGIHNSNVSYRLEQIPQADSIEMGASIETEIYLEKGEKKKLSIRESRVSEESSGQ
eukprot:Nk52_evm1s261 gene=Nk52_evmTU1s261